MTESLHIVKASGIRLGKLNYHHHLHGLRVAAHHSAEHANCSAKHCMQNCVMMKCE